MIEVIKSYRQQILYIIGGALSAAIDIGLVWLCVHVNINYVVSISVGFFISLLFNYAFHAMLTFNSGLGKNSFWRYIALVVFTYILTLFMVTIFMKIFKIDPVFAKILTLPIIAILGFIIGKKWVFVSETLNPPP